MLICSLGNYRPHRRGFSRQGDCEFTVSGVTGKLSRFRSKHQHQRDRQAGQPATRRHRLRATMLLRGEEARGREKPL